MNTMQTEAPSPNGHNGDPTPESVGDAGLDDAIEAIAEAINERTGQDQARSRKVAVAYALAVVDNAEQMVLSADPPPTALSASNVALAHRTILRLEGLPTPEEMGALLRVPSAKGAKILAQASTMSKDGLRYAWDSLYRRADKKPLSSGGSIPNGTALLFSSKADRDIAKHILESQGTGCLVERQKGAKFPLVVELPLSSFNPN